MNNTSPLRAPPSSADVTAREPSNALEVQVGRLQSQLEILEAQVRQAQQLSALGTAAAMIAHEVNNLLTPILSYAQAALAADDSDLQKKALSVTVRHVRMLIAMSDRVLEISAAKPTTPETVCVRGAVQDAVASLCRDLGKDGIRLSVDVDDSVMAQADPLQLQQVLFNLFLNAREVLAPRHNGRLVVSAGSQGDRVTIKVRNTGDPIPAELLPHIFEPFQTSKPAMRDGRRRCGGLGLALCRDLVEDNSGTITVTSDADTGTTFTITLPAACQ